MNFAVDTKFFARWVPCPEKIPENAVPGGKFTNGEELFIGRQRIKQNKEEFIPGYILPSKMELIVPYGTGTKRVEKFEILVSDYQNHLKWVKHTGLDTPIRPVTGGCDAGFYEPYYIGKTILSKNIEPYFQGRTCTSLREGKTWRGRRITDFTSISAESQQESSLPGKIHLGHECLYVGYESKEYYFKK